MSASSVETNPFSKLETCWRLLLQNTRLTIYKCATQVAAQVLLHKSYIRIVHNEFGAMQLASLLISFQKAACKFGLHKDLASALSARSSE